jgi:RNA polymerase sigma factor (sigma-70 family)
MIRGNLDTLVVAAARGDAEAYGELVTETSPLVSSIALAIVHDLELSRDVAQDVYLSAWRDLKKLRNPQSFLPWLRQTARNRAKTALRTNARRRTVDGALDEILTAAPDQRPSVTDSLIADEERRALADALAELPEETREVLMLFYREGQSVAQVASLLELSEVAVKKRLSRARASLRESVEEQIGMTLRRTAPGAAFTTAVVLALPISAPSASAAVLGSVAKAGGSAGLAKLLTLASGVLIGGAGGVLGVILGVRKWMTDAQDDEERRALRFYRNASIAVVVLYAIALTAALRWTENPWWALPWFVLFIATLAILQHVWLPRIVRRRMEAEMKRDPNGAIERRRRERRQAILGWTIGLITGGIGLAAGLWSALRNAH